jgi:hypothetical protein
MFLLITKSNQMVDQMFTTANLISAMLEGTNNEIFAASPLPCVVALNPLQKLQSQLPQQNSPFPTRWGKAVSNKANVGDNVIVTKIAIAIVAISDTKVNYEISLRLCFFVPLR